MSYFAGNGVISSASIADGIEITEAEYQSALVGMLSGQIVAIEDGSMVLRDPPKPLEPEPTPEPTAAEITARRIAEIDARLTSLDLASIRALTAKALDTATEEDLARLAEIEAEKAALRAERARLVAS